MGASNLASMLSSNSSRTWPGVNWQMDHHFKFRCNCFNLASVTRASSLTWRKQPKPLKKENGQKMRVR